MEEQVGQLWHRFITRMAGGHHSQAAVGLPQVSALLGIYFRALGGDGALQVVVAEATEHGARRTWLQRIAGSGERMALAWRDHNTLRLPEQIDLFPEVGQNRDLYLWLAALAAVADDTAGDWLVRNQDWCQRALTRFPGIAERYRRLVAAHLPQRPDPGRLPPAEAEAERHLRQALQQPGSVTVLPPARRSPWPVPLWLHPDPPSPAGGPAGEGNEDSAGGSDSRALEQLRKQAERVDEPQADRGLITIRMENIFTFGEFINLDRGSDDEDDLDRAEATAREMDRLAISRSGRTKAARLKFDLDLPGEAQDDIQLGGGFLLPEWDWRKGRLQPDHCRIQPMLSADAVPCALPGQLRPTAKRLRRQFQALAPARIWLRARPDGQELDLDACVRHSADRAAGAGIGSDALYRELRQGARDLACLLLADLSLSTDTYVSDHARVIDVIRDALFLFGEALGATGDRFAIQGFSSRKRDPIRVHLLKGFDESYSAGVRGRIQAIKPGYYTRMGAAIRYASLQLKQQAAGRRLLLLLSDGKPNDLDQYEGRYGIEDTRQAILEARRLGIEPFCVTIDARASQYLPHLFGAGGFIVIRNPLELPKRLPLLYARLTA